MRVGSGTLWRRISLLLVLGVLLALDPTGLAAQQDRAGSSRLVGTVLENETGAPVEGVAITLPGRQALTNAEGRFAFLDLAPATYRLRAHHLAYGSFTREVEVPFRSTVDVEIRLAIDPVELEPIRVTAVREHRLQVRGFYERKEWGEKLGLGHYFTREDLDKLPLTRVSQLMHHVPGIDIRHVCGRGGCYDVPYVTSAPPRHSGSVSFSTGAGGLGGGRQVAQVNRSMAACPMQIYVNGINVRAVRNGQVQDGMDNLVSPWEVSAVEVYRRASEMPAEYIGSDAQCGVVAIWTR